MRKLQIQDAEVMRIAIQQEIERSEESASRHPQPLLRHAARSAQSRQWLLRPMAKGQGWARVRTCEYGCSVTPSPSSPSSPPRLDILRLAGPLARTQK